MHLFAVFVLGIHYFFRTFAASKGLYSGLQSFNDQTLILL